MREKQLDCSKVNCLVFDEADNMLGTDGHSGLDENFETFTDERKKLARLLFSATFNEAVKTFATKVVPNATRFFAAHELSLDVIKQYE